jgi:hypothetical protein
VTRRGFLASDLAVGAAAFLLRVPFLFDGFGSDPDAWRVAWAGRVIRASGAYQASRAPGNPIPEYAAAALAGAPAWASCALTALFGAIAVASFGALLRRLGVRAWVAGAMALAVTPVIAIHSSDGMDYLWALAFLLGAFHLALDGRAAGAGLLVGLAAGCRLTSLAMLLPYSIALGAGAHESRESRGRSPARGLLALWFTALAAAAASFAPALAQSGFSFLHDYETGYPPPLYVLKNATVDVWGVPGCIALAAALAVVLARGGPRGRRAHSGERSDAMSPAPFVAAGVAIAIELALFLRLPHEAAYLVPGVPFALLLLFRALSPPRATLVAVALALSSLTCKVSESGKADEVPAGPFTTRVTLAGRALEVHAWPGPVPYDRERRRRGTRYARAVRDSAAAFDHPVAIVAYEWLPQLRVLSGGDGEARTRYLYLVDAARLDSLRAAGTEVFDLPGASWETERRWGFDLRAHGSRPLPVSVEPVAR